MVNRHLNFIVPLLAMMVGCSSPHSAEVSPEKIEEPQASVFFVHEHALTPRLAIDPDSRRRGLQNQTPPDDGLILCFQYRQIQSLWMPNCPESLEAWVMSDHGEVLEILPLPAEPPQQSFETDWTYHNRLPRHVSSHETQFMWEFASGEAQRRGIMPGDIIEGPWFDLRDRIR